MSDTFDHEGDALDELLFGRGDEDGSRGVTCRYCGKRGLQWHRQQAKVLVEANGRSIHVCQHHRAADISEFEVLP